ncbi:class I SAM-dependent methyltransferase [Arthrobacter agilis]|uniref:class I SAM-dependent methyltransferase n=1 Tax=Arthrobacter agilis TaxID=37921 RepID=UPI001E41DB39|nr:methyltransferase domain-containing protein [Arthrobacter agilis]
MSGEFPVYRAGRLLAVRDLDLAEGAQVLDVGCGTGLNFGLLQRAVGPTGWIVGIDRSPQMLARARRKAERRGWSNVILIEGDATTLSVEKVREAVRARGGRGSSDAALATYALSLMPGWEHAWERMKHLVRPAGTLSVVDMQEPQGAFAVFGPLARLACRWGGADITAAPWRGVERDCVAVRTASARGDHLQVRTGRRP